MPELEIEKSKPHILIKIIEYLPNSAVIKKIIHKITGNISVTAFDTSESLAEKISPFDTFIQFINRSAQIIINKNQVCYKQEKLI